MDETLGPARNGDDRRRGIVGIGIHTGNARRGYEMSREARRQGAWVVYGGIHATLFPDEAVEHGSAHAVVRGDGDVGSIKRLTDKGFGFIAASDGSEYFFHQSACSGMHFDELREGQPVTFDRGQGPKGPRAENIRLAQ